jgi:hypothetical protein
MDIGWGFREDIGTPSAFCRRERDLPLSATGACGTEADASLVFQVGDQ